MLRSRCGKLAGKRMANGTGHSRPRPLPTAMGYEAAVGDSMVPCRLTETPHASVPASKLAPTDHATKPLWEACWQANGQRSGAFAAKAASHSNGLRSRLWEIPWYPAGSLRRRTLACQPAGRLPRIMLRSRRGKLAGKRMANGAGHSRPRALPTAMGHEAACGRFHGALQAH